MVCQGVWACSVMGYMGGGFGESVFDMVWRIKILRKSCLYLVSFAWLGEHFRLVS